MNPLVFPTTLIAAMPAAELAWLEEVQTPPPMVPEDAPQLCDLLVAPDGIPITTPEAWLNRREELKSWWLEFLGPGPQKRCDLAPHTISEETVGNVMRKLVRLQVEEDCWMEAYLLHPIQPEGKLPGVVVFHSTVDYTIRQPAGLEGESSKFLGLRLAERGFVTVCPRCFIWDYCGAVASYEEAIAELGRRHPGWRGIGKMVFDGSRAADYLVSLPFVDAARLGCIGHSLGAKETLYVMAFDERFQAGISSEGGIGLGFSNWEAPWYLGPDIRAKGFEHENHEVLSLIAPRAFLLIGGESADGSRSWPFIERAKAVYDLLGASHRIGLLTHSSGHSLPAIAQECSYGWLKHFLDLN
ncbi:MAG: dienelactone hydrolase family protein [Candidatus Zipacnadales bacterium]